MAITFRTDDGAIISDVWVICKKCNNAWHRVLPGEFAPYWYCQDEKCSLLSGQEVEVHYLESGK